MKPVNFKESNFTFNKPASMTDEECSPLPVFRGQLSNGAPVVISCWEFDEEELKQILLSPNRKVWLYVFGTGTPPVALSNESPFIEP